MDELVWSNGGMILTGENQIAESENFSTSAFFITNLNAVSCDRTRTDILRVKRLAACLSCSNNTTFHVHDAFV